MGFISYLDLIDSPNAKDIRKDLKTLGDNIDFEFANPILASLMMSAEIKEFIINDSKNVATIIQEDLLTMLDTIFTDPPHKFIDDENYKIEFDKTIDYLATKNFSGSILKIILKELVGITWVKNIHQSFFNPIMPRELLITEQLLPPETNTANKTQYQLIRYAVMSLYYCWQFIKRKDEMCITKALLYMYATKIEDYHMYNRKKILHNKIKVSPKRDEKNKLMQWLEYETRVYYEANAPTWKNMKILQISEKIAKYLFIDKTDKLGKYSGYLYQAEICNANFGLYYYYIDKHGEKIPLDNKNSYPDEDTKKLKEYYGTFSNYKDITGVTRITLNKTEIFKKLKTQIARILKKYV